MGTQLETDDVWNSEEFLVCEVVSQVFCAPILVGMGKLHTSMVHPGLTEEIPTHGLWHSEWLGLVRE